MTSKDFKVPDGVLYKLEEKYRKSSVKTLIFNLRRILGDGFGVKDKYTLKPLMRYDDVVRFLEKDISNRASRKNILASVIAFLKTDNRVPKRLIDKYEKLFLEIGKKLNDVRKYKKPDRDEREAFIPFEDVIKLRKEYKKIVDKGGDKIDLYTYIRYLLLSLYTYIPPLRGEEYLNAVVVRLSKDSKPNYEALLKLFGKNIMDIEGRVFAVGTYKTSDAYGMRLIKIPKKVANIVGKWYEINGNKSVLIPNLAYKGDGEEAMNPKALTAMFNRIFGGRKISTSMLRKIYISHMLGLKSTTVAKRKELARIMGHSLEMQEFEYSRFKNI